MKSTREKRAYKRRRECPRWLAPPALFLLSVALHAGTLRGGFVWDDRPAVVQNRDVWTDSSWSDMWRHDFWGQRMSDPESHKSFRPLTTITYRLNNEIAKRFSRSLQGGALYENGPQPDDSFEFHLVNVLVHASTCTLSFRLFRSVFAGENLPALVAATLFTVHPIHVEAVAPIVGRADLLCGFFAVLALCLTVDGHNSPESRGDGRLKTRAHGSNVAPEHEKREHEPGREDVRTSVEYDQSCAENEILGSGCRTSAPEIAGVESIRDGVMAAGSRDREHAEGTVHEGRIGDALLTVREKAVAVSLGGVGVIGGHSVTRFIVALVLATAATLCKEVGVTIFFIIGGAEIVRFIEASRSGTLPTADGATNSVSALRSALRAYFQRFGLAPAARFFIAWFSAALAVLLHLRLHDGQAVREWGVLENDISTLPNIMHMALSYAFTHAFYGFKLVWPDRLCYDWGFRCIPHVTSPSDPHSLAPLILYLGIAWCTVLSVSRADTARMWGLAMTVVPFVPASNVLFPIGAVVAERLLYLPSLGACLLAGCTFRRPPHHIGIVTQKPPATFNNKTNNSAPVHCRPASIASAIVPRTSTTMGTAATAAIAATTATAATIATAATAVQTGSTAVRKESKERNTSSIHSRSGDIAISDPGEATTADRTSRERRKRNNYHVGVASTAMVCWCLYFSAETLRRCGDWRLERRLFESALQVCPNGIKTLNNLASLMLNPAEALRAEGFLRRAIELYPDFPSALFNLGVALTLRGSHDEAIQAMARSLSLDGSNTKALVYLGQEYLAIAREQAMATITASAKSASDPQQDDSMPVQRSSPEELFAKAEFYTDQALASGSTLPLARLVKGDILILRSQFKSAADYFRSGIDLSLALVATAGGREQGHNDALNLPAMYNKLGLALGEMGTDPGSAKEAFSEGLLLAPDDLALLVNGGAAHQATGDWLGAGALYRHALAINPESPELLSNLGWLEEQSGGGSYESLTSATALYERALAGLGGADHSLARNQVEINLANVRARLEGSGRT